MSDVLANGLNVNVNIQPSAEPDAGHIEVNILPTQSGEKGDDGATFRPAVSENGILSWTNDKNLENPEPVNIKGPEGKPGKSAYEVAKENGFEGTEEEWLESLKAEGGSTIPTDGEILEALIDTDFLLAVQDENGAILTDENGNIILM